MSADDATATESTITEEAIPANPFDAIREQEANTDAGAPEATPPVDEQAQPSSSTTDQPITPEPTPKNPLAAALATPAEPVAPAKPAAASLPPELDALTKDPAKLQQLWHEVQLGRRQATELGQLRQQAKRYEGLPDPEQIRQTIQAQEQAAQKQSLNAWNRDHPRHGKFNANRVSLDRDYRRLERADPASREAIRKELFSDYSPEEIAEYDSYQAWRKEQESEPPEARDDRIRQMARAEARQEFEERMQYEERRRSTQEYIAKNPDVLGKHRDIYELALDEKTTRTALAEQIVALKEQLANSTGQRAKDIGVIDTAKAREQITKASAVVGRDAAAPKAKPNTMKIADEAHANGESPLFALSRALASHSTPEP